MARPGPGSESRLLPKVAPAPSPQSTTQTRPPRRHPGQWSQQASTSVRAETASGLWPHFPPLHLPRPIPGPYKGERGGSGSWLSMESDQETRGPWSHGRQRSPAALQQIPALRGGLGFVCSLLPPQGPPSLSCTLPFSSCRLPDHSPQSAHSGPRNTRRPEDRRGLGGGGGRWLFQEHHLDVQSIITITPRHGQLSLCNLQLTG